MNDSKKKVLKLVFNFHEISVMVIPIATISVYCDILFLLRANVYKKFAEPARYQKSLFLCKTTRKCP